MSTKPDALAHASAAPATCRQVDVQRESGGDIEQTIDFVAEERPVELRYQGVPHVVMLTSPADLEDLGVGFTLSEGVVADVAEVHSVRAISEGKSLVIDIHISGERFAGLLRRRRNMTARTGCGLCGIETVEAIRAPQPVRDDLKFSRRELQGELERLHTLQPLNQTTGSVHAAAWVRPGAGIQVVREDVGRHNALDKVIGALARSGVDSSEGYFIITSRASFEMAQKAAMVGVSLLAAVSAPTALAIDLAQQTGLTLIGFARKNRHVVYAHPQRLQD
ncbi:MAG TPA: formate dehydrogenase accessory sulfurtransferase FdhD [Steroidobacter sp.]|nr:formate dehydrogenase accessory sulfurtransferase FdhD [Steroidobacteraceae bacterium]HLS80461.1 formate dehydrogenase accessory sulfurtransferase FdhD [Steroidobacter sp.]